MAERDPGDERRDEKPSSTAGGDHHERSGGGRGGLAAPYVMVGGVLVGLGIGSLIDYRYGTKPVWTLICFFVFLVAAFYHVIRDAGR